MNIKEKILQENIKNANDWIEVMWNMDVLDHKHWEGLDEAQASLQSYLKGYHKCGISGRIGIEDLEQMRQELR